MAELRESMLKEDEAKIQNIFMKEIKALEDEAQASCMAWVLNASSS